MTRAADSGRALVPGDVVAISYRGVTHEGIVASVAPVTVVHASMRRGVVAEEPLAVFSAGRRVRRVGYYGTLPRDVVVAEARARVGDKYLIAGNNCQRFTRACHGVRRASPDAPRIAAAILGGTFLGAALIRRVATRRMAAGAQ